MVNEVLSSGCTGLACIERFEECLCYHLCELGVVSPDTLHLTKTFIL